jgi:hypothetical protein
VVEERGGASDDRGGGDAAIVLDSVLASAMTTATKVELEIEGLEWFLNEIEVVGGGRLTRQRVATRLVDGRLEGRCFCVIRRGGGRVTHRKKISRGGVTEEVIAQYPNAR